MTEILVELRPCNRHSVDLGIKPGARGGKKRHGDNIGKNDSGRQQQNTAELKAQPQAVPEYKYASAPKYIC